MDERDKRIMKYVPKSKQAAVRLAWHDDEGYWITLNDGYRNGNWGGHVIHEDTIAQLRKEIAAIEQE